ncbi:MAG: glycosyltransferase family 2 protein [Methanobacteriaceae archaeon]|jgi:GT2 family glycosyltransferase|nr:glycosyltransferase family 2 protein [Candidatus Methanorudis spinitermitis]
MKVSVVIPNFNGKHFLNDCFLSLNNQEDYINEVIIIDNGSTDGSQEFIKNKIMDNFNFKINLIENEDNLGFSTAVNQGIKNSHCELVFLLNNDVELDKGCILNLIKCINSNDNIFSASSKMIQFENRDLIDDAGNEYTILGWTKKIGNNKNVASFNHSREIFSSCGGAALYKKDIFDEIGHFDENFFAYMEDVDIGYRALIEGYKNIYCPSAQVFHIGSGTSGSKYNEFKIKLAARNNIFLPYKNMPIPQLILNFLFLGVGFFIKLLFFLLKGYGIVYLAGLFEGLKNLNKVKRTKYKNKNIKNYLKIELKLILNLFKF